MPQYPSRASSWGLGTDPADDWRELAACRDEDPELFFPVDSGRAANAQIKQAKAICRRCPVRARCLEAGMSEEYGVWGGLTEEERRALRQTPERPERQCEDCGDIYRAALASQRRCYARRGRGIESLSPNSHVITRREALHGMGVS